MLESFGKNSKIRPWADFRHPGESRDPVVSWADSTAIDFYPKKGYNTENKQV